LSKSIVANAFRSRSPSSRIARWLIAPALHAPARVTPGFSPPGRGFRPGLRRIDLCQDRLQGRQPRRRRIAVVIDRAPPKLGKGGTLEASGAAHNGASRGSTAAAGHGLTAS
jgi:hypothetical protein